MDSVYVVIETIPQGSFCDCYGEIAQDAERIIAIYAYQLTIPKFLEGFKQWMEVGNYAEEADGTVDPFAIAPEQADSILRYALLEED